MKKDEQANVCRSGKVTKGSNRWMVHRGERAVMDSRLSHITGKDAQKTQENLLVGKEKINCRITEEQWKHL